jgi:alcohol-forming fatty acyl-CoA reductase
MVIDSAKSIPAFYAGQSIFLTGATGCLGKMYIEKILRSCPDIREIFLLIRPKGGLNVNERLEKILNLPLFERLRDERPSIFEKLIPICGNNIEKELGLSATDRKMLIERVSIIIHGAASVKFNNTLKYSIFTNLRSTRDICILAQSMKNLKVLVYISTAFTNTNVPFIEEKTYPPIADWQKMIKIAESLQDEHALNILTPKCLDFVRNTYIFSKNLSESVIQYYSSSLPCAIVRPSMVYTSVEEPMPGWIDNVYGPIGLSVAIGKGLLHVIYCNKYANQNIVPVDIVIKAIIVASWKVGLTNSTADSMPFVLNCTNQKGTTSQEYGNICFSLLDEIPLEGTVWIPYLVYTENLTLFYILTILLHMLPAMLLDLILYFSGRRPKVMELQRKLYVANCAMSYFMLHNWKYSNTNTSALISSMPPDDRDIFSFDYSHIDLRQYFKTAITGGKKFLLHEDMNRLDAARTHYKRLYLFITIMKYIIFIGILWIMYKWIYSSIL